MWSSTFPNLLVVALAACASDPDVVIDVSNNSGGPIAVYGCKADETNITDTSMCALHELSESDHSVGLFASESSIAVVILGTKNSLCEKVDVDLSMKPIDITFDTGANAGTAIAVCSHDACGPITGCTQ